MLSFTLSNTTIVSYSENPRMVRNATTVAGVTSKRNTEYTPTLINTSCNMAMIAERAIRHSNRQLMNSATSTRKMTSARIAFSVMLRPHDELTDVDDTSSTATPACSASCVWTTCTTSWGWSPTCTFRRLLPSALVSSRIFALAASIWLSSRMPVMSSSVIVPVAGTSQATPPSKSMPRLSPCANNETMVTTIRAADAIRPHLRRP